MYYPRVIQYLFRESDIEGLWDGGGGVIPVDITQICRFGRMIDSAENDLDIEQ